MAETEHPVDVVAMPSLRADGSPDQTPGFQVLDDDGVAQDPTPAEAPADEPPAGKTGKTA